MKTLPFALLAIVLIILGIWLWLDADQTMTDAVKACLFPGALLALSYLYLNRGEL